MNTDSDSSVELDLDLDETRLIGVLLALVTGPQEATPDDLVTVAEIMASTGADTVRAFRLTMLIAGLEEMIEERDAERESAQMDCRPTTWEGSK